MIDTALLKCLECRLVGRPPVFSMPPPPPPPELLESLFSDRTNEFHDSRFALNRCYRSKNLAIAASDSNTVSSMSLDTGVTGYVSSLLNSNENLFIFFFVCSIMFVTVLLIALIFLVKLFKIKKQLYKATSNSQISHKALSSSLTNSTTASSVSSSNTISSNASSSQPQLYNQLFSQQQNQVQSQYLKPSVGLDEYSEIMSHYPYDTACINWEQISRAMGVDQNQIKRNSAALLQNNLLCLSQLQNSQLNMYSYNNPMCVLQQQHIQDDYVC